MVKTIIFNAKLITKCYKKCITLKTQKN